MKLVINFFPALRNARIVSVGYLQEFHEGYHSGILFPIFFFPFPIHIHPLLFFFFNNKIQRCCWKYLRCDIIIDSVIASYQKLSNNNNNNCCFFLKIYIFFQCTCFGNKLKKFLEIEWIKYGTRNRKIKLKDINTIVFENCSFFFLRFFYFFFFLLSIKPLLPRISAQFFSFNISILSQTIFLLYC